VPPPVCAVQVKSSAKVQKVLKDGPRKSRHVVRWRRATLEL